MTRQDLVLLMLKCIEVWTSKHHPGNYVGRKIAIIGEEYEWACNNKLIGSFRLRQFDAQNQMSLLRMLPDNICHFIMLAYRDGEIAFDLDNKDVCVLCKQQSSDLLSIGSDGTIKVCSRCKDFINETT